MSWRGIISIATLGLLALILLASQHEIMSAWQLLGQVNLLILALLIPAQILVYYAAGEMIFSYLRTKGEITKVSKLSQMRMSLELNFVNHILPSGGVSGVSYMTWRLSKYNVSPGRATMSQIVRYATGFLAYLTILLISVVAITLDTGINRFIILFSSVLASTIIFGIIFGIYIIKSKVRLEAFAQWLTKQTNATIRLFSFGRKRRPLQISKVQSFFNELHNDYIYLRKDGRILIKPYLWGLAFNLGDIGMFLLGFWALGIDVNPAAIAIAYGVAALAATIVITPGGIGAYEALMITIISSSGTPQGFVIAGVLLTRIVLLFGTIVSGYIFYQLTVLKHGKRTT